ncbi:MAG: Ser/Thr protein phosphatase [Dehalococcoidia bacterium]|nr:Ser/Thr protein phosphatase [Dehalococcoidia bacterium]
MADIHANLEALDAVLADAREHGAADQVWCLGDTVGYGPDPQACIDTILGMNHGAVAGNHDWATVGKVSLADFNPYAAAACRWGLAQLSPEHVDYLTSLPLRGERGPFTLVHGSPRDPIWEYILSLEAAQACFHHFATPYCLVGHSHIPFICRQGKETAEPMEMPVGVPFPLGEERLIINPGSVGQPRDGDPRASYIIYDEERSSLELRRVPYDLAATQRRMRLAGLPESLAERLQHGQ